MCINTEGLWGGRASGNAIKDQTLLRGELKEEKKDRGETDR